MATLSTNWKQHFILLAGNKEGNKMMLEFSNAITATKSVREKSLSLVKEVDSVIFISDKNGRPNMVHSPMNFRGTRTRDKKQIACLLGIGPLAMAVILNERQATKNCKIAMSTLNTMHTCTTAETKGC